DTIRYLVGRCPSVHFVWIMGADNLRSFHRWQNWRGITRLVPIAVVDRLGPSLYSTASASGRPLERNRIPESAALSLAVRRPPVWVYLHGLKSPLSSTALRAARVHKSAVETGETDASRRESRGLSGPRELAENGPGVDSVNSSPIS